eukprot:3195193-Prorocentrum_lima.AAC.1
MRGDGDVEEADMVPEDDTVQPELDAAPPPQPVPAVASATPRGMSRELSDAQTPEAKRRKEEELLARA